MSRIVNVHHVDFAAFMKGDVDYVDPEEIVMVFEKLRVVLALPMLWKRSEVS